MRSMRPIMRLCDCGIASNRSATKPDTETSGASPQEIPHARKNHSLGSATFGGTKKFLRILVGARGTILRLLAKQGLLLLSPTELEYQFLLARDLKLLQSADYKMLSQHTVEIKRMLAGLLQKLNADRARRDDSLNWLRPQAAQKLQFEIGRAHV